MENEKKIVKKYELNWLSFCLENDKRSTKGVSTYTKREPTQNEYKQTLIYCSLVRSENVLINSCSHSLQNIKMNKFSLSAFDNKRYIQAERVTTCPFGHKRLREDMFIREMGAPWTGMVQRGRGCHSHKKRKGGFG